MISAHTTSRHGPTEETGTDHQAPHTPALRFFGWHLWYGKATGRYWALSPAWCRERIGLIEATTPAELAAQIQNIESYRPKTENPPPSNESDMTQNPGGDQDDRTPAVPARRRTR
ncbi:hypothetical protein [Streptosporangium sp. NPDC000509]|uniref:hypothetical protein n=1 Tax=Streptosporangium sp. NPDC000509 TaxID=3366186 RepID=UPI003694E999